MRTTRRVLMVAVVLLMLAAAVSSSTSRAQGALPDLKGREIIVVTAQDYVPLTFVDAKSGQGMGMEYDIINEVAKRLNAKLTFKVAAWDGMIVAVSQKQYDIGFDGISITDDRKKAVDFSDPYINIQQKFLVRADEKDFTDSKSFVANTKLKIGAQVGTSGYYAATDMLGEKSNRIVLYDTFGFSVQALLNGDVDAVISDVAAGRGYIGANAGKLKLLDESLSSDTLGFMFTKGSDLVVPFNAALAQLKSEGLLDKWQKHWFFEFDPSPDAIGTPQATAAAVATTAATPAATSAK